jgi:hypothetical protein
MIRVLKIRFILILSIQLLFSINVFAQKSLIPSNKLSGYLPTSVAGYSVVKGSSISFTKNFASIASQKYINDNFTNSAAIELTILNTNELYSDNKTIDNVSDNKTDNEVKAYIDERGCSVSEQQKIIKEFPGVFQSIDCGEGTVYNIYIPLVVEKNFMLSVYLEGARQEEDALNIVNAIDLKGLVALAR